MNLKHSVVKLLVNNLDDLWVLYNIIDSGDLVYAKTTREVKVEDSARPSNRRIPVSLGLRVEKASFDRDVERLRIHGVIAESPEELGIQGSHHTIGLVPEEQITIVKEKWLKHHLDRLKKASVEGEPITIVAVDMDECCIAVLRGYGVDVKAELRSRLPGKLEAEKREEAQKKYFSEILSFLSRVHGGVGGRIAIVGPGFAKDNLARFLRDSSPELSSNIVAVKGGGSGGVAGVYESIRSGVVSKVMMDARVASEVMLVEEVLRRLGASMGNVSYGLPEVEEDASAGAVDKLLVSSGKLRSSSPEDRRRVEGIMRLVEDRGGTVVIVGGEHEGERKLDSLGGIAAFLRYKRH